MTTSRTPAALWRKLLARIAAAVAAAHAARVPF
jgi:hypothetical protein